MSITDAIDFFGGKSELAKAIGITYQSVHEWEQKQNIPRARQFQIQVLSKGKLKPSQP